ncbi:MAG TPA: TSUP family transporter [Phycicoccus sp.]|nr:TSUP family transporter [Phycicoccus sp.]
MTLEWLANVIDWPTVLALAPVLIMGAFVQSTVGFGINVVAAPFVLLVAPDLMPGALVLNGFVLPLIQWRGGLHDVAWEPLRWNLGARVLATPVGVWLVLALDARAIGLVLAALILVTVAASVRRVTIRATRGNALVTGALSGLTGTSAAVGGPFSALLFQHEPPDRLRDTLAVSFLLGSLISVIGLVPAGELTWADLVASLVWSPFVWIGYAVSGPARRRLDAARLRVLVLAFCVVAALVLIGRALLG